MNEGSMNLDDTQSDQELMQQTIDNLRYQNKQIFSLQTLKHPLDLIEDFLHSLYDHYFKYIDANNDMKSEYSEPEKGEKDNFKTTCISSDLGILNNYYVTDETGNTFMLDKSCENDIENLMYGRVSCFFVKFQGEDCQVKLHPNMLNSNFPMIMLCKADKFFAISKRLRNWTHISLFGFQPAVCGMRCDSSLAHEMLKNVKDTGSLFCESFILKKLCCLYLRIDVHTAKCTANVFASKNQLLDLFNAVIYNPDHRCFFLLSGQSPFFAYIQVNDRANKALQMICIGSFAFYDNSI